MANIGKTIRQLCKKRNMTQDQLAEALHVTRQTVSNYETGNSQPDINMIVRLAEVFQCDPNTLIYGVPVAPDRNREYIRTAILMAIALAFVIFSLATKNIADEQAGIYVPLWRVHRQLYILPVTYLALGYALMQLLSLTTRLKPIKCMAVKVILLIMVTVYLYLAVEAWYNLTDWDWLQRLSYFVCLELTWNAEGVLLLPGAGLWLFRIKK